MTATSFVGRERELKLLHDVFARARAGSGQLVTLLGEPGIGKTRLSHEFAAVAGADAVVARAPWTQTPQPVPYAPLMRALVDAGLEGAVDPDAAEISRDEALLALLRVGEVALARRPLVVLLDNLHLADDAVLDLAEDATARFAESPLMMVCIARDELLERRPSWAGGRLNAMTVALRPLADEHARELAAGVEPAIRDWVVAAAEGNPLFIAELLTYVREHGLPESSELPPPPTLQAIVGARLERLKAEELAVLQRAAIVGRTFEAAPVEALYGAPVEETLRSLAQRELLRRWREGYVFQHQLLLEVVYRSIPPAELPGLHRRLADWYERTGGGDAMVLRPMHLYSAYDYEPEPSLRREVARSLAFTGTRMAARGNVRAAVVALERAAELVEGQERLPLLYELANVRAEAGDVEEAQRVWREAEEQARATGDRRTALLALIARSDSTAMADRTLAELEQHAREAIAEFEAAGDAQGLSRAWSMMRLVHSYACRGADALDAAQRALGYARAAGSQDEVLKLLPVVAAQHYWGPTPAPEALEQLQEFLDELHAHPSGRANVLWMLGGLHAMLGEFAEARRLYAQAGQLNRDLGRTIRDASVTQVGGAIELLAGDAQAAERELRRGARVLEQAGERSFRPSVVAWLGRALAAQGRLGDARSAAEEALATAHEDDRVTAVVAHSVLADVEARSGDARVSDDHAARCRAVLELIDEPIAQADALADLGVAARALDRDAGALVAEADALYAAKGSSAGRALLGRRVPS